MHASGSHILTAVENMRRHLEQSLIGIYTDDYLVRYCISQAVSRGMSAISMGSNCQAVLKKTFTMASGQTRYKMPPTLEQVWGIRVPGQTTASNIVDLMPRAFDNPRGQQWRMEGRVLVLDTNIVTDGAQLEVYYTLAGESGLHYGDGEFRDAYTFRLASTPTAGSLDRREDAYIGHILRVIPTNTSYPHQFATIKSYDPVTRDCGLDPLYTADLPLQGGTYQLTPSTTRYEVLPLDNLPFMQMVAAMASLELGESRNLEEGKIRKLNMLYDRQRKTIFDSLSARQNRVGKGHEYDTVNALGNTLDLWTLGRV